jgi:proteasome lid subunit RPN8/RPN11
MCNRLVVDAVAYDRVLRHLHQDQREQVAFGFASAEPAAGGVLLRVLDFHLVSPGELEVQTPRHVALTEDAQGALIKRAWDLGVCLVELHSHTSPHYRAEFSWSDLAGFQTFVPHVWWRLKGRPYAAVVVAPSGFDALIWRTGPRQPEPLEALVVGTESLCPTNLTLEALHAEVAHDGA